MEGRRKLGARSESRRRRSRRRITNDVERRNVGCRATRDMTVALPVARWQGLGVRLPNGKALPAGTPVGGNGVRHDAALPRV